MSDISAIIYWIKAGQMQLAAKFWMELSIDEMGIFTNDPLNKEYVDKMKEYNKRVFYFKSI